MILNLNECVYFREKVLFYFISTLFMFPFWRVLNVNAYAIIILLVYTRIHFQFTEFGNDLSVP